MRFACLDGVPLSHGARLKKARKQAAVKSPFIIRGHGSEGPAPSGPAWKQDRVRSLSRTLSTNIHSVEETYARETSTIGPGREEYIADRLSSKSETAEAELRTMVVCPSIEKEITSPVKSYAWANGSLVTLGDRSGHHVPYFLERLLKATHGRSRGISHTFPSIGMPRGPGGSVLA